MSTPDNNQHGSTLTSNKEECTSCKLNNEVDAITDGINKVDILSDTSMCASCGKEGNSNNMNTCNKCKSVKYCNAACKKKHRTKHKKACEKRVAELYDEQLFKEVEPAECPICMLPLPSDDQTTLESCCGKKICNGCIYAMRMSEGKDLCAFCRTPPPSSDEEEIERTKNLMDNGNGEGCLLLASYYDHGLRGLTEDHQKAITLCLKAGELGSAGGYYNLGIFYDKGIGVERDPKKAKHYYELAVMSGCIEARFSLGLLENREDNPHRAFKHFTLAARAGNEEPLDAIKLAFQYGLVTKDEYASTLRVYHERQKAMKSDERDKAAHLGRTGEWDNMYDT